MRVDNNDNGNALPHVDVVSKQSVIALHGTTAVQFRSKL